MTQGLRTRGAILAAHAVAALALSAHAADCNRNGVEDAIDVAPAGPGYRLVRKHFLPQAVSDVLPRDMNADGKADLVGLVERESILVALGEGEWRWGEPSITPIPALHDAFLVEDLDGDGNPDAVTAGPQTLAFFFNDGRGGLQRAPSEDVLVGSSIAVVRCADVDGDGLVDIVTLNELENISVLRNGGGRRFEALRNYASGIALDEQPENLAAADFDGDGRVDLALSAMKTFKQLIISFLWNDGQGRFQDVSSWRRPWLSAMLEGHADFDEDGDEDLFISAAGRLVVLKTDSGRVPAEVNFPFDLNVSRSFLLEDLDLDGRSEIILSPGHCAAFTVLSPQGESYVESMSIPAHGTFQGRPRAADLDGDGDKDLLVFERESRALHLLARDLDVASGDCNGNLVPDACEDDCNANGFPDACDIEVEESGDCDGNGVPDECDPDCNGNRVPDPCEIREGAAGDCNGNGVPDACDVPDRNGNAVPDECEIAAGGALDCNGNGIPDDAEAVSHLVFDARVAQSSFPRSFTMADLDGDGSAEILIANGGRGMDLLLWNEHRGLSFQALEAGIPWQLERGEREVADFDRDGDLDLAVLASIYPCGQGNILGTLENLGDGRFRLDRWHPSPELSGSLLLAGEFDGDGRTDILAWSSAPLLFRGSPGGLAEPRQLSIDETLQFSDIASIDLDRDGDLDLVTDTGIIFSNPGDARFFDGGRFPAGLAGFVEVIDFAGDGLEDLLTGGLLAQNRGGGLFVERRLTSENVFDGAVADFDGDGLDDIVLGLGERLLFLFQRGGGFLERSHRQPGYGNIAAADVNRDGRPDLVALRPEGVVVHWNLADPPFAGLDRFVGDGLVASLEAADLDRDGDMDLAGRVLRDLEQSELAFWVNDGAGSLVMETALSLDTSLLSFRDGLVARDMDGDGDVDFAVPDAAGLVLLERVPDGRLSRVSVLEPGNGIRDVIALDIDRDGDQDLAAQSSEGQIFVLLSGGWPAFESVRLARPVSDARGLSSADIDGDGDEDLLQTTAAGVFSVMNGGDRSFSAVWVQDVEGEPQASVLADLDEDGDPDLVVSHCTPVPVCDGEPLVTFLRNDGRGFLGDRASWQVLHLARDIEAVDLEGDGDVDLVLPQSAALSHETGDSGRFAEILLNLGDGELRSQGPAWIGAIPGPVAAADLDRDGTLDIALGTDEGLVILPLDLLPPSEPDADGDGILDSCSQVPFRRGDWNADGRVDLTDAVALLARLFLGGEATGCDDSGDADDDGKLDLTDPLRILRHLFQGEAPPPAPHEECGEDPTGDGLACLKHERC